MFEKEAEEIAKRKISNFIPQQWGVSLIRTEPTWETVEGAPHFYLNSLAKMWQDGAEFGYNKANEWHYPSKGEYPKEYEDILICFLTEDDTRDCVYGWYEYDFENAKHIFKYINVLGTQYLKTETIIAWKEIVLPELPKESE